MNTPQLPQITNTDIRMVMTALARHEDEKIAAMAQEELEQYWHFGYNPGSSPASNLYAFFQALQMYQRICRRWEEHHYGHQCVVERVRDTYLMPKLRAFLMAQREAIYHGA